MEYLTPSSLAALVLSLLGVLLLVAVWAPTQAVTAFPMLWYFPVPALDWC